jgi:hypothetical protein
MMASNHSGAAQDGGHRDSATVRPVAAPPEPAAPEPAAPEPEPAEQAPDASVTGTETGDLPLWDWAPSGSPDDPEDEAAEAADPPRPEWNKPVVTPVEEAGTGPRRPGIGQDRGNLAHLSADPRMRVWQLRALVAVTVLVAFSILVSWKFGLTLAVIVVIADTIYRSRRGYSGHGRLTRAQRHTRRQLAKLRRAGYRAVHSNPIPESEDQIDHLVVGPAGVFAIDSEAWNKHLPVRTSSHRQLWLGPESKKDRLEHARWESERAADLLSRALGSPVTVRPAMAVYGPKILWDVATIREVDVFQGPKLRRYLRRRARQSGARPLTDAEIEQIYKAAHQAFPHLKDGAR